MSADPREQPPTPTAWLDARDPWRVFFPLGVLLGWAGVLHWLSFAAGLTDRYRAVFHATVQIQGFMTSIAVGFLFTFVPRRTGTAPPSRLELVAGAGAPILVTLAAWQERWAIAQALWVAGVSIVAAFVVRRLRSPGAERSVPGVFVWVPMALLSGIAGAALVAVAAVLGPREEPELWQLGRGLLLQGFVSALVVGVGGTMLPTLTHGPGAAPGPRAGSLAQATAALLFLASFPVEVYVGPRPGFALRAAVAGGVLVWAARLWRPPSAPGLHRWFIWISSWLLPAGYLAAAADPALRSAALHVVFIGSFALLALSVSLHVALSHGGRPERLARRPWQVWAMGLLLLAAAVFRLMAGVDPAHLEGWLAPAASCFLLGTVAWMSLVFRQSALRQSEVRDFMEQVHGLEHPLAREPVARMRPADSLNVPREMLNAIIAGDCIEGMRRLPDGCVDIAVIDPPYNLGKGGRWSWDNTVDLPGFGGAWQKAMQAWDDHSLMDYFRFTLTWLAEVKRVVKPTGSLWIHGTYHNVGIVNFALQLLEIEIINEVVWYKRNSFPNLAGRRLTASHETILWAHTGKKRQYLFHYKDSKAMECPGDLLRQPGKQMRTVWDVPNNKDRTEIQFGRHPTQKPLRLLRRMLALSAPTRGLCLAPFAGAGSECVAAVERGLDFVAFETEAAYAEIAQQRIAEARRKPVATQLHPQAE